MFTTHHLLISLLFITSPGPDWTKNQSGLGKSATNFGQLVDRHGKKGSPVVPGSLQKVLEDGESVLYTVTVLRSMYEVREQNLIISTSKLCAIPAAN